MDPGAVPAQYSQLLDCICSWGQVADILELITDWLTEALPKQGVSQYSTKEPQADRTWLNVHYLLEKEDGFNPHTYPLLLCESDFLVVFRRKLAPVERCVSRRRWRPNLSWRWLTWNICSATLPHKRKSWLLVRGH